MPSECLLMGDRVSGDERYAMIRLLLVLSNLIYVLGGSLWLVCRDDKRLLSLGFRPIKSRYGTGEDARRCEAQVKRLLSGMHQHSNSSNEEGLGRERTHQLDALGKLWHRPQRDQLTPNVCMATLGRRQASFPRCSQPFGFDS